MKAIWYFLWIASIVWMIALFPSPIYADTKVELNIAVSSSLTQAMEEAAQAFEQKYPQAKIRLNIGAGGALRVQAEQGAPMDIIIDASRDDLEAMATRGLIIPDSLHLLCKNTMALVLRPSLDIPRERSFHILLSQKIRKIAVGDPTYVPAGQYAEELLKKLDLYPKIQGKLVFASTVRQALAWAEAGEADAALVYGTDARISKKTLCIVESGHIVDIAYGIGILKQGANNPLARRFINFIMDNQGQKIIRKYGFLPGE